MELDAFPHKFDSRANNDGVTFDDLSQDSLKEYRSLFNEKNPGNLFSGYDDHRFFRTIGALKEDGKGEERPTNAAILLFGNYLMIKNIFPEFNLDYREDISHESRWDYRLDASSLSWSGNIFDFFRRSLAHIQSYLPNRFHLEGATDDGGALVYECVREGLANALTNCDFLLPGGVTFSFDGKTVVFQNAGRMRTPLEMAIAGGSSDPRNEGVMNLLHLVRIGDKAGLGIHNIFARMKKLGYDAPDLQEFSNPNKTRLVLSFTSSAPYLSSHDDLERLIVERLSENGCSAIGLAKDLGAGIASVKVALDELERKGMVGDNGKKTKGKRFFLTKN